MAFFVGVLGAILLYCGFTATPITAADEHLQWAGIVVGAVFILVGLVVHYRWGGGDE